MSAGPSSTLQEDIDNHLIADGLSCVRGDKMLFRDLNFVLKPGQAGLLTGPNGVGKSSLLRLIAGLLDAFSGRVNKPGSVALCDDRMALDEHRSLEQALSFWARLDGRTVQTTQEALSKAGIEHLSEVPIRYFSTGQRQRARLARIYQTDAKLWLLDEPANGLDTSSVELMGKILQAHLDDGGTILAASHIPLPIDFELSVRLAPLEQLESTI